MNATANTPNIPAPTSTRTVIESNHMGGRWIDRIYLLGITEQVELINKNSTKYQSKVYRRRITLQNAQGENFFAVAYESADGRWFDNCGMPIKKPMDILKDFEQELSKINSSATPHSATSE
jgi:hypothetical protein